MLKWTATQQKFSESISSANSTLRTPRLSPSKRRKRRATIANKENIVTSTPMVHPPQKFRYSPLVLAPLTDILNLTPEPIARTPKRETIPRQYASTLPKFEEEYSPSIIPPGQVLAIRGLLPDTYIGNPRYFTTPEQPNFSRPANKKSLPKKRKLDMDFADCLPSTPAANKTISSSQMGDETLDKLIDAILDTARKDKKKKPRKSFNLRRRTLIKNTTENVDLVLSPSYAPADDPASDLSFLRVEAVDDVIVSATPTLNPVKKMRTSEGDCRKYFEIGLALPSIYV